MTDDVQIAEIDANTAAEHIDELVEILLDSVAGGSSVNYLAGVKRADVVEFWERSIGDQAAGGRRLIVAERDGTVIGTVMLMLAPQQNQPHRADVGKMLVHSAARRQGIGARLLVAVEALASRLDRTLLMLDTEKDSAGERLYAAHGWIRYGEVPGHALSTVGVPTPTSFFYKQL